MSKVDLRALKARVEALERDRENLVAALNKLHDVHRWDADDVCMYCGLEIHVAASFGIGVSKR